MTKEKWLQGGDWNTWKASLLPLDKMAAISQTIFSDAFSWMKKIIFWSKLHWILFLSVQLIITQHWFIYWLGAEWATSHYLNQCRPDSLTHICGTRVGGGVVGLKYGEIAFIMEFSLMIQKKSHFRTCHDSWAVVACAKLCPDWSIIVHVRARVVLRDLYYVLINHLWSGSMNCWPQGRVITRNMFLRVAMSSQIGIIH